MRPDHMLHMARFLLDSGVAADTEMELDRLFPHGRPPPTSKEFVQNLEKFSPKSEQFQQQCPICINYFTKDDQLTRLPCKHTFHVGCITPWLEKTSSCPVCRHELPTDNADYERYKAQKERAKQREAEIETLHNSMFS